MDEAALLLWAVSSLEAVIRAKFLPHTASEDGLGRHCVNHRTTEGPVCVMGWGPQSGRKSVLSEECQASFDTAWVRLGGACLL